MTRLGLIRNPRSRRNQGGLKPAPAGLIEARPDTPEALAEALEQFRRVGVDLLVIDGGDGTVRDVLTALGRGWSGSPPALAILPSGKTNVIAADVGVRGLRADALERVRKSSAEGRLKRTIRPTLRIDRPGLADGALFGFVFGTGAYARATDLALTTSMRKGRGRSAVARALAQAAYGAMFGRERSAWLEGEALDVHVDGSPRPGGRRFLYMATSLDRLMLGIWPFWGEGSAPIKILDVAAPPKRLLGALPAVVRGRPRPWMEAAGYRSERSGTVSLRLPGPFILDGEAFEPGTHGQVTLSADQQMVFVSP